MANVLTNNTNLAVARESAFGTLPGSPTWYTVERNSISSAGSEISTVARDPIQKRRSARKGAISDLDSGIEFEMDFIVSTFLYFAEAILMSVQPNDDAIFEGLASVTGTGYTIPSASAATAALLQYGATGPKSLVYARGFSTTANNGLKILGADVAATDTEITVSGLTAEASPPSNCLVELAGVEANTSDLSMTVSGTTVTLTSGNGGGTAIDFTTLGLTVGQFIHIGGDTADQVFTTGGSGFIRVTSIAAGTLIGDKAAGALVTDAGTNQEIRLLFGRFYRDLATDNADFLTRFHRFEREFPDLSTGPADAYEYMQGNLLNTWQLSLPLTDKSTMTFAFVGKDTPVPTTSRATNAASQLSPVSVAAQGTSDSESVRRLRITDTDETVLVTDFKSATINVGHDVTGEKIIGTLGPASMNRGNLSATTEIQFLLASENPTARIRNNTTVTFEAILKNDDGVVAIDYPSATIGGGSLDEPRNETMLQNATLTAFEDATLGYVTSHSYIPYVPALS